MKRAILKTAEQNLKFMPVNFLLLIFILLLPLAGWGAPPPPPPANRPMQAPPNRPVQGDDINSLNQTTPYQYFRFEKRSEKSRIRNTHV